MFSGTDTVRVSNEAGLPLVQRRTSSQTKKHPSGENTGRWTKEEHQTFLDGLKQHGKEWKKIASLIATRTVVQIRTHAQKYFQKLAKSRGIKGEEIPSDLISTASNPRHMSVADMKTKKMTGLGYSLSSPIPRKNVLAGEPLPVKHGMFKSESKFSSSGLLSAMRGDSPLPTRVLGEERLGDSGCSTETDESDSVIMELIGEDSVTPLAPTEEFSLKKRKPHTSPLKRKLHSMMRADIPSTPKTVARGRVMSPPGSATSGSGSASLKKSLELSPKMCLKKGGEELPYADVSSLQQNGSPEGSHRLADGSAHPLVSPRVSLGGDEEEGDIITAVPRRLTISANVANSYLSEKDIKSREEDDLKWMVSSMSNRLPDGSPTAVTDFGFYRDFDGDDMLFPGTPSNNCDSNNDRGDKPVKEDENPAEEDSSRLVNVVDGVCGELCDHEAQSIEEWITSSEASESIDGDSDLISVASGELEHQPELAEMGPFTKYVFGDDCPEVPEGPASKRQRLIV